MWNGPNKTQQGQQVHVHVSTNTHKLQRKDLLRYMVATLDTSQLLRSALNALASKKAVVFWEKEKEG